MRISRARDELSGASHADLADSWMRGRESLIRLLQEVVKTSLKSSRVIVTVRSYVESPFEAPQQYSSVQSLRWQITIGLNSLLRQTDMLHRSACRFEGEKRSRTRLAASRSKQGGQVCATASGVFYGPSRRIVCQAWRRTGAARPIGCSNG
jgi:hypothetical protein